MRFAEKKRVPKLSAEQAAAWATTMMKQLKRMSEGKRLAQHEFQFLSPTFRRALFAEVSDDASFTQLQLREGIPDKWRFSPAELLGLRKFVDPELLFDLLLSYGGRMQAAGQTFAPLFAPRCLPAELEDWARRQQAKLGKLKVKSIAQLRGALATPADAAALAGALEAPMGADLEELQCLCQGQGVAGAAVPVEVRRMTVALRTKDRKMLAAVVGKIVAVDSSARAASSAFSERSTEFTLIEFDDGSVRIATPSGDLSVVPTGAGAVPLAGAAFACKYERLPRLPLETTSMAVTCRMEDGSYLSLEDDSRDRREGQPVGLCRQGDSPHSIWIKRPIADSESFRLQSAHSGWMLQVDSDKDNARIVVGDGNRSDASHLRVASLDSEASALLTFCGKELTVKAGRMKSLVQGAGGTKWTIAMAVGFVGDCRGLVLVGGRQNPDQAAAATESYFTVRGNELHVCNAGVSRGWATGVEIVSEAEQFAEKHAVNCITKRYVAHMATPAYAASKQRAEQQRGEEEELQRALSVERTELCSEKMRDYAELHADGLLTQGELVSIQSKIMKGTDGDAIDVSVIESLRARLTERNKQFLELQRIDKAKRVNDALHNEDTGKLAMRLHFDSPDAQKRIYAALTVSLADLAGLVCVKDFIRQRLSDAIGRYNAAEDLHVRHVLLEGGFGCGKRTSAELIARCAKVTGVIHPHCGESAASADPMQQFGRTNSGFEQPGALGADAPDDDTKTHVVPIQQLQDLVGNAGPNVQPRTAYFIRVKMDTAAPECDPCDAILDMMTQRESFVILAGEPALLDVYMATLSSLKIREPHKLVLPDLAPEDLAAITVSIAERRGYRLQRDQRAVTSDSISSAEDRETTKAVMTYIVQQKYDVELIKRRNAHLGRDMLERAISRKNERCERERSTSNRMMLTPQDFGVEIQSPEALARRKAAVDEKIAQMIGWGDSAIALPGVFSVAAGSTNANCSESQVGRLSVGDCVRIGDADFIVAGIPSASQVDLSHASAADVADASAWNVTPLKDSPKLFFHCARAMLGNLESAQSMNWNVVVTGNTGCGKSSFAELAAEFLRAYGITRKDEFVQTTGLDLKGSTAGSTGPKIKKMFAEAQGGAIFIDECHALAEGQDTFGKEVIRTLLTETVSVSSALVIIAGYKTEMGKFMRMDPGLDSRFPQKVHIDDYSPRQLVEIASSYAVREFDSEFEEGLEKELEDYIDFHHGGELHNAGNARLAENMVDAAVLARQTRNFQAWEKDGANSKKVLSGDDFKIHERMGASDSEKDTIDGLVNELVGMEEVKQWFTELKAMVRHVEQSGDKTPLKACLNIVLTGNPGTGKTTFAGLLHRFLFAYGILEKDNFKSVNGLEMKGAYMGDTAPKVKSIVAEANGGCLFVDEVYALADNDGVEGSGGDAFAREAIRTMLTEFESNRSSLMVVFAGYKQKMDRLMRLDQGLARRFPKRLHLPDYSPADLAEIAKRIAQNEFGKSFEDGLDAKLAKYMGDFYRREIPEQNAGLARNLIEAANQRYASRMAKINDYRMQRREQAKQELRTTTSVAAADDGKFARTPTEQLATKVYADEWANFVESIGSDKEEFTAMDFNITATPELGDHEAQAEIELEIEQLIGMTEMKVFFAEMKAMAKYVEAGGRADVLHTSLNMVITGNPGTGKTTCSRLIARYLHSLGVLPTDRFVEKNALELKGAYVGQTTPRVQEAVKDALGGCLFLDEAYALADRGGDAFSGEAVRTLLTEVENNRTAFLCVLAGYEGKMANLMRADPGLPRRFATSLHLVDYSPHEIALICQHVATRKFKLNMSDELTAQLGEWIERRHPEEIHQSNGGLSVNLTEAAFRRLGKRVRDQALIDSTYIHGNAADVLVAADFLIDDPTWTPPVPVPAASVGAVLAECRLEEHEHLFEAAGVTDDVLGELNDPILQQVGIQKVGHRLRIIKNLRERGLLVE